MVFIHDLIIEGQKLRPKRQKILQLSLYLIVFLFLPVPLTALRAATEKDIIGGNKCQTRLESDLKKWSVTGQFRQTLEVDPRNFERSIFVSPTKDFAQWVRVEKNRGHITLYKVSTYNTLQISYDKDCFPKAQFFPKEIFPNRFYQEFSDAELKSLVKKNQRGLIYVWSQENPQWQEGLEIIKKVAAKAALPLTVLLLPKLTRLQVLKLQSEHAQIESSFFRQMNSVELEFQGAMEKSPALLYYSEGKIHPDALYGVKNQGTYEDFLRAQEDWAKKQR